MPFHPPKCVFAVVNKHSLVRNTQILKERQETASDKGGREMGCRGGEENLPNILFNYDFLKNHVHILHFENKPKIRQLNGR